MKTLEILKVARALIEKPENWTQGTNARGKSGNPVICTGNAAVCWCAHGAITRAAKGVWYGEADRALTRQCPPNVGYIYFNDTPGRTHPEVLALFDKAIEAEAGE